MTLEGFADDGNIAPYRPDRSFYQQDFAVMSGLLDLWRPSKAKEALGVIATGAGLASAIPVLAPFTLPVAAAAGAGAAGMALIHSTYAGGSGDSPNPGTGYQPVVPQPVDTALPKKTNLAVPIALGVVGLIAAFGIAS